MNQDRIWELVSLKLSGEAKQEELEELAALLQQHPDEGFRFETLNHIWDTAHQGFGIQKKEAFNRHMQRLSNHLSEPVLLYENVEPAEEDYTEPARPKTMRRFLWVTGIAASIALVFFLFPGILNLNKKDRPAAHNTVSTKRGSKSKVQLPDGTQVWLNADSRITYNEDFQCGKREVTLEGEAFFDVVRDEKRPFIIHTEAIDLKVLGTSFNVRSYADEKNTETSLIHGSVEITLLKSADRKKIILKPNDKLIVKNHIDTVQKETARNDAPLMTLAKINYKKKDSTAVETLWVKNKLAFDQEPLEDIALKIERWFDVKVIIRDEGMKKDLYTYFFDDESLKQVMEALQLTGKFKYSINKREVTILP